VGSFEMGLFWSKWFSNWTFISCR